MKKEEIMKKYKEGSMDKESILLLEQYIEEGVIDLNEIEDLEELHNKIEGFDVEPSSQLSDRFYTFLSESVEKNEKRNWGSLFSKLFSSKSFQPVAIGLLFVLVFISGLAVNSIFSSKQEINNLTSEIEELKETMVLSMIERPSTTDRLKAVHLTEETGLKSNAMVDVLLQTFNNDESTNVRLAALEVLVQNLEDSTVREGLIRSIASQTNPIIQMHLMDIMTAINEKKSSVEFEKLLEGEDLEPEVKTMIHETVETLSRS